MSCHVSLLLQARRVLGDETPIPADCGLLCNRACCLDRPEDALPPDDEGTKGMLLLPGETSLFTGLSFSQIHRVRFSDIFRRPVWLLTCQGHCPRRSRPMACRIFPLIPFVAKADREKPFPPFSIVGDPRGKILCPLAQTGFRHVTPEFFAAVEKSISVLWESKTMRDYFVALSVLLDDYFQFY